jgi:hypothetical protein
MTATPTWATTLRNLIASSQAGVFTALPGVVEEFFEDTKSARVRPSVMRISRSADGERETSEFPPINRVPVIFPGSGGVRVKFPVSRGDHVLLLFSHSALDNWLETGRVLDQGDDRHHDINDCVAIPGIQPFSSAGDADTIIEFTSLGEILLGGGSEPTFKALTYGTAFNTLIAAIATAAAGTGGGVTTAINSALTTFNAVVGKETTVVKVD